MKRRLSFRELPWQLAVPSDSWELLVFLDLAFAIVLRQVIMLNVVYHFISLHVTSSVFTFSTYVA